MSFLDLGDLIGIKQKNRSNLIGFNCCAEEGTRTPTP